MNSSGLLLVSYLDGLKQVDDGEGDDPAAEVVGVPDDARATAIDRMALATSILN